jgi:hypothetical protein
MAPAPIMMRPRAHGSKRQRQRIDKGPAGQTSGAGPAAMTGIQTILINLILPRYASRPGGNASRVERLAWVIVFFP